MSYLTASPAGIKLPSTLKPGACGGWWKLKIAAIPNICRGDYESLFYFGFSGIADEEKRRTPSFYDPLHPRTGSIR